MLANAAPPIALGLLLLMGVSVGMGLLLRRLRLDLIPAYLLTGALLGPHALGLIPRTQEVSEFGNLATILLMFGIGLHLDPNSFKKGLVSILVVGGGATLAFAAFAFLIMRACGVAWPAAVAISLASSISSTAVFVRIVTSRREVRTTQGRVGLGVSIVQDIISVVVMAILPPLAHFTNAGSAPSGPEQTPLWLNLVSGGALGIGGVTLMLAAGRFALPWALAKVAKLGTPELLLVAATAIALGAAVLTSLVGFSVEMGAFLAGLMLAGTPFRYQLSGQIAPMRDLLLAVFFTAVGLKLNLAEVAPQWWMVLIGAAAVTLGKAAILAVTGWAAGVPASASALTGAYLGNAGEFTLVIVGAAAAKGVVSGAESSGCIAVVVISLLVCPMLVAPAHRLSSHMQRIAPPRWIRKRMAPVAGAGGNIAATEGSTRRVIIAGYGPVGRSLAEDLLASGVLITVVELNPRTVERQTRLGRTVVYGDITNPEVLDSAGVRDADAVVLTIPDDETTVRACGTIRTLAPDIFIAARAGFLSSMLAAKAQGADCVIVEEIATAQAMKREVMERLRERFGNGAATE